MMRPFALTSRLSIRTRLTLVYATLFTLSSAVVLIGLNLAGSASLPTVLDNTNIVPPDASAIPTAIPTGGVGSIDGSIVAPTMPDGSAPQIVTYTEVAIKQYLQWSIVAMIVMLAFSIVAGWLVAGRVLSPLHRMTDQARRMSPANLDERFDASGPHDELRALADTFDSMLDRIERAFASERALIANMSHELRTPLTTQRALLELTFDPPDGLGAAAEPGLATPPSPTDMVHAGRAALAQNERAERIIEAMLVLARAERTDDRQLAPTNVAAVVANVANERRDAARARGIEVHVRTPGAAQVPADPQLLERLIDNLVSNAIGHGSSPGECWIDVEEHENAVRVSVSNTGALLDPETVAELRRPFRRGSADRVESVRGHGLGLTIVQAIATFHHAELEVQARDGGGLTVEVTLPRWEDLRTDVEIDGA